MSDQDWAACNLNLRTAGRHTTILWVVSCHGIKKQVLLAVVWTQFMPFSFVLFAWYHSYLLITCYCTHHFKTRKCALGAYSLQKTGKLAHPPQGTSEHTTNQEHQLLNQEAPKRLLPQPPHRIGFANVRQHVFFVVADFHICHDTRTSRQMMHL